MWPFKKKEIFKQHDLNKWIYLGNTQIKFTYEGKQADELARVYYFENKKTQKRSYYLDVDFEWDRDKWLRHKFVKEISEGWRIGESTHAEIIRNFSTYLDHLVKQDKALNTTSELS